MAIELTCEACGKQFTRPRRRNPEQRFCSPKCNGQTHTNQVLRTCIVCGKDFQRKAAKISDYCSDECSHKARRKDVQEAFWAMVDKTSDCWLWTGAKAKFGHGLFTMGYKGRTVGAHRFSYELSYGPIPNKLIVCHHCDVPACVRPDHLFIGTRADNRQDCVNKDRQAKGEATSGARLTENEVHAIRSASNERGKIKELATQYSVNPRTITKIRNGTYWKHI